MMRVGRPSLALAFPVALFWPFACAVYNDESLGLGLGGSAPLDNSVGGTNAGSSGKGGDGNTGKTGGTSGAQAGSAATGGTAAETTAGSGGGGPMPGIGGDGSADGGEASGGDASGGKGGSGGAGGVGSGGMGGKGGAGGGNGGSGGAPTTAGASGSGGNAGSSGNAGSGGTGPTAAVCSDHPLTARASWKATASHPTSGDLPPNLLDGKITRWSTGKAQSGDEWLQLDFGVAVTFNHVNLQQGDDTNDYPRTYSVVVSNTAKDLNGTVSGTGSGKSGVSTAILLPALATGRYLLIKQTATSLSWWSAEEIEVSCSD